MPNLKKKVQQKYKATIEEVEKFPPEAIKLIPSTDSLKEYINNRDDVLQGWVAKMDGKIVGLVTIETPQVHGLRYLEDTRYIQVIVSPKARGAGIGDSLVKTAMSEAEDPPKYWAGFTNHSPGFKALSKKYGIRDNDDVSRYDPGDAGWKKDGTYEEHE